MARFVVAIDGGAGSGKSTTAKAVARRLDFFYLDTGAMYRAVTLKYLQSNGPTDKIDRGLVRAIIEKTHIDLQKKNDSLKVYLDDRDVTEAIRTPPVNAFVSPISALPEVREWMVQQQRDVAAEKNVVCEGRDIGTVVFPDAQVKIFMLADLRVRARRRLKELEGKNIQTNLDDVIRNLTYRDELDSNRDYSPLKKAEDAVVVNTTCLTIDEEITMVEEIVRRKLSSGK